MKSVKSLSISLFALALASCGHVQFPDFPAYSVAGDLQAGADYAWTGHDETGSINMREFIDMLEDGAICMRSGDFKKQKTAAEQACVALGKMCSQETLAVIRDADKRTKRLGNKDSVYH